MSIQKSTLLRLRNELQIKLEMFENVFVIKS